MPSAEYRVNGYVCYTRNEATMAAIRAANATGMTATVRCTNLITHEVTTWEVHPSEKGAGL